MKFASNGVNEIFFVDGAEHSLSQAHHDALTSAAAHFLECFRITHEVDVYISQRSIVQTIGSRAAAYHMPPTYDRKNSIVGVFVDPGSGIKNMITLLAHEMIHAWQVHRGDLVGTAWKGVELGHLPYGLLPWEIEAHGHMKKTAESFFQSRVLSSTELEAMKTQTDSVFEEVKKQISAQAFKEKFKNVAKIAAGVGLAALVGI